MCDQYPVLCMVNTLWWWCQYPVLCGQHPVLGVVKTLCYVVNTLCYVGGQYYVLRVWPIRWVVWSIP